MISYPLQSGGLGREANENVLALTAGDGADDELVFGVRVNTDAIDGPFVLRFQVSDTAELASPSCSTDEGANFENIMSWS